MARRKNRPEYTDQLGPLIGTQPKGLQVYERLIELMAHMKPGTMLPSERVLAEQFEVARPTVRAQIDALVREGLAVRVVGSGTFSAEPRLAIAPTLPSFSREILALGMTPGTRMVSRETRAADDSLATLLGVRRGSPVLKLVRIRTADEHPLSLERTQFSLERYPGLDKAPLEQISLRDHLRDTYGSGGTRAERRFTIATVNAKDAALLEIEPGASAFRAEVTIFDPDDRVVEVGTALLRADRYEIRMHVDTLVTSPEPVAGA